MQSASIYSAIGAQDQVGGYAPTYSDTPAHANVLCTAQPHEYEEVYEDGRVTQLRKWRLMFTDDMGVRPRDKIVFSAPDGTIHTIFAELSRDEGGRGMAYTVRGTERL